MNSECTDNDISSVKELLAVSTVSEVKKVFNGEEPQEVEQFKLLTPSFLLRSDLSVRTQYHQAQIVPGITDELIHPFQI